MGKISGGIYETSYPLPVPFAWQRACVFLDDDSPLAIDPHLIVSGMPWNRRGQRRQRAYHAERFARLKPRVCLLRGFVLLLINALSLARVWCGMVASAIGTVPPVIHRDRGCSRWMPGELGGTVPLTLLLWKMRLSLAFPHAMTTCAGGWRLITAGIACTYSRFIARTTYVAFAMPSRNYGRNGLVNRRTVAAPGFYDPCRKACGNQWRDIPLPTPIKRPTITYRPPRCARDRVV